MAVKDIVLLGNPRLYDPSESVEEKELDYIRDVVQDLHDTLMASGKYNAGRAMLRLR